ncbi:D-alanyl-D-alanine carboxypeptidase/D-alanyl-D-alanine-endopeptidase [Agrobacterium tumefaciens]|nr:D-alanyl-D-alanine carboxypeptidase/D-alanyl-D-alanine-endopeptidase [Agrobacterium tumefaciens]NTE24961.1 D-alanyl-D-alanine carboxypeptidase/D-alanyl-D-alanine-endopeptidase [Agrobacterium tumefaciens]
MFYMKKSLIILLYTVFYANCFAQNKIQNLEKAFNTLLSDEQAKHAITSICVLDASTGKILFARNEQIGLATASTLKTITAASAFSILGKDFQFQTTLSYSGEITPTGTLKGHILITGSGDPTLGSSRYQNSEHAVLTQWVEAIKSIGIKRIEGSIIGDDQIFGTQTTPEGWVWQDIGNYYGAGTSGLAWRENQFDIQLRPGSSTSTAVQITKTVPSTPYIQIENELKTGSPGSGDRSYSFLPPYSNIAYLRGTWGMGIGKSGISVALPDPAFDCAYRLQDTLNRLGIQITQEATTTRLLKINKQLFPAITQKINTITSPTLSEMTYWFLKKSINLYGETLLKTIALKSGKPATTSKGAETEINFWTAKGIDQSALNITDGSGLSPGNRITTAAMANILFQVQNENWFPDFYKALPEYNGMKIKSGTINDVSAFAGYHTDAVGNKYVIVININNYSGSGINKKLFRVLDELK